jgi:hypothetical protein
MGTSDREDLYDFVEQVLHNPGASLNENLQILDGFTTIMRIRDGNMNSHKETETWSTNKEI